MPKKLVQEEVSNLHCDTHDWDFEIGDFCPICHGIKLERSRILDLLEMHVWCEQQEECLHVESCVSLRGAMLEIRGQADAKKIKTYDAEEVRSIKHYSRAYGVAEERDRIIKGLVSERDALLELTQDIQYVEGMNHAIIYISEGY